MALGLLLLCFAALIISIFSLLFAKIEGCYKIISLSSLVLSIVAVCCSSIRMTFEINDSAAFISIICGIIVLPTTILIGWNIYQLIDVKNLRDELEKSKIYKQDIQAEIDKKAQQLVNSYRIDQLTLTQLVRAYDKMVSEPARLFVLALDFNHTDVLGKESVTKLLSYQYAHQLLLTMSECWTTDDEIEAFAHKVKEEGLTLDTFNVFMKDYSSQSTNDKIDTILSKIKKAIK